MLILLLMCMVLTSLPTRGAWIEISCLCLLSRACASLPTRGAWIEMSGSFESNIMPDRRSPHGERGLKFFVFEGAHLLRPSRSPHGERGLKCYAVHDNKDVLIVAPHTGSVD